MTEALTMLFAVGLSSIVGWLTNEAMSNSQNKDALKQEAANRVYDYNVNRAMGATENGADFNNANT